MGKIIVVAGVPGTGKTSVSRELASLTGFQLIELGRYALERGLVTGFDDERGS
ncbi:MAG: AAA family ATPase, partial [Ignisphaera sp.]